MHLRHAATHDVLPRWFSVGLSPSLRPSGPVGRRRARRPRPGALARWADHQTVLCGRAWAGAAVHAGHRRPAPRRSPLAAGPGRHSDASNRPRPTRTNRIGSARTQRTAPAPTAPTWADATSTARSRRRLTRSAVARSPVPVVVARPSSTRATAAGGTRSSVGSTG
ncbi:hypothetical protein [Streptomyces griseoviridis]|uniref:hypothetical protein n=1 Tax=Streptomyces griseoviridis TaxID=45398 RepID=UPI00356B68D6